MKEVRYVIVIICMLAVNVLSAQNNVQESVRVKAVLNGDSVLFQLTAFQIETQLTFLMQGLDICVIQYDTLTMSFPSAVMVKNKVKRHPNEVKAMLESQRKQRTGQDSINHVVRPDVQPLVAALNDTLATIAWQGNKYPIHDYRIGVDRQRALMTFSFKVHKDLISSTSSTVQLSISSVPLGRTGRTEFAGRRLSEGNSPHPNGLGEGIRKEDVAKRTFRKYVAVEIVKPDEE